MILGQLRMGARQAKNALLLGRVKDVMEKKEGAMCTRSKKRRDRLSAQG